MKCPKCELVTSDSRDVCPRCGLDLRPHKERLGIVTPSRAFSKPEALLSGAHTEETAYPHVGVKPEQVEQKKTFGFLGKLFGATEKQPEYVEEELSVAHKKPITEEPLTQAQTLPTPGPDFDELINALEEMSGTEKDLPTSEKIEKDCLSCDEDDFADIIEALETMEDPEQTEANYDLPDLFDSNEPSASDSLEPLLLDNNFEETTDGQHSELQAMTRRGTRLESTDLELEDLSFDLAPQASADEGTSKFAEPRISLDELSSSLTDSIEQAYQATSSLHEQDYSQEPQNDKPLLRTDTLKLTRPDVLPEVKEFSDDDELLEQELDAIIGDLELNVEAVKTEKPEASRASSARNDDLSFVVDDIEISFEVEVDNDESAAEQAVPEENDHHGTQDLLLDGLLSSFNALDSETEFKSVAPEIEDYKMKSSLLSELEKESRSHPTDPTAADKQNELLHELTELLAEAYGVSPEAVLGLLAEKKAAEREEKSEKDDLISALEAELEAELAELSLEGTTFYKSENQAEPTSQEAADTEEEALADEDAELRQLEQEFEKELAALEEQGFSVASKEEDSLNNEETEISDQLFAESPLSEPSYNEELETLLDLAKNISEQSEEISLAEPQEIEPTEKPFEVADHSEAQTDTPSEMVPDLREEEIFFELHEALDSLLTEEQEEPAQLALPTTDEQTQSITLEEGTILEELQDAFDTSSRPQPSQGAKTLTPAGGWNLEVPNNDETTERLSKIMLEGAIEDSQEEDIHDDEEDDVESDCLDTLLSDEFDEDEDLFGSDEEYDIGFSSENNDGLSFSFSSEETPDSYSSSEKNLSQPWSSELCYIEEIPEEEQEIACEEEPFDELEQESCAQFEEEDLDLALPSTKVFTLLDELTAAQTEPGPEQEITSTGEEERVTVTELPESCCERLDESLNTGAFLAVDLQRILEQATLTNNDREAESPAVSDDLSNEDQPSQEEASAGIEKSEEICLDELLNAFADEEDLSPQIAAVQTGVFLAEDLKKITEAAISEVERKEEKPEEHLFLKRQNVPELLWHQAEAEVLAAQAAQTQEVEIGLNEMCRFEQSETLSLFFSLIEEEIIDPSKKNRHSTAVPKSESRVIENTEVASAVQKYQQDRKTYLNRRREQLKQKRREGAPALEVFLAPIWRRTSAFLLDAALCLSLALIFTAVGLLPAELREMLLQAKLPPLFEMLQYYLGMLTSAYVLFLFIPALTAGVTGQTPGGRVLGIEIVDEKGYPITMLQSFVRSFAQSLCILTFGLGALAIFGKRRRAVHDMVAKTQVAIKFD